jgi:hypothetical protein
MKPEHLDIHSDGARIPLSMKEISVMETSSLPKRIDVIDQTLRADIWKCPQCNFIALFQGEP